MMYCMLFVGLLLIQLSESQIVHAKKPINQTCLNLGYQNNCEFYKCFEERFPCGTTDWMLKWGYKYCTRMKKSLPNFDKNGQELLKQISACLINRFAKQPYYKWHQINCEKLRLAGQRIVHECYMASKELFCRAFKGQNRDCFIQLMDNEDRQDLSIIRTLLAVGQTCTPKRGLTDMRPNGKMDRCASLPTI